MTVPKAFAAAVLISAISATSALAQEPAAFQSQYPDRDYLNGGALTPAGRLGLERAGGAAGLAAASDAYAGTRSAGPAIRPKHRRHPVR